MKTGDPKQVVALGVVALLAVGFVGSTAIKTVKQNSFSGPVVVEEVGNDGTVVTDGSDRSPSPTQNAMNDVFADSFVPAKEPEAPLNLIQTGAIDTEAPTIPKATQEHFPGPLPGVTEPAEPEVKTVKPDPEPVKPKKKTIAILYMGFVESGSSNPSAIISVNGANLTVVEGDSIGKGLHVKSISSNTITVKGATETFSISLGKEKHIS